mmetsp:Transcript_25439/g.72654  ORF Transcript_25439/g.72654 Transcript_25439/m.72654 type:complete len:230 (+) Transcript_25439:378-1067(+)
MATAWCPRSSRSFRTRKPLGSTRFGNSKGLSAAKTQRRPKRQFARLRSIGERRGHESGLWWLWRGSSRKSRGNRRSLLSPTVRTAARRSRLTSLPSRRRAPSQMFFSRPFRCRKRATWACRCAWARPLRRAPPPSRECPILSLMLLGKQVDRTGCEVQNGRTLVWRAGSETLQHRRQRRPLQRPRRPIARSRAGRCSPVVVRPTTRPPRAEAVVADGRALPTRTARVAG